MNSIEFGEITLVEEEGTYTEIHYNEHIIRDTDQIIKYKITHGYIDITFKSCPIPILTIIKPCPDLIDALDYIIYHNKHKNFPTN